MHALSIFTPQGFFQSQCTIRYNVVVQENELITHNISEKTHVKFNNPSTLPDTIYGTFRKDVEFRIVTKHNFPPNGNSAI